MVNEKIYIYGIHTCLSQIENNPENINKIYIKNSSLNKNLRNILDIAKQRDIIVSQCEKTSMDALILSNKHQGVVMEISKRSKGHKFSLDYYIQTQSSPLILIIDSIQDPRNLGSCIRTANAAGVTLIIKRKSNSCSITPLVSKTSSGGMQNLDIYETNEITKIVQKLRANNILVIGTDDSSDKDIFSVTPSHNGAAIVVGSEGEGIRKSLQNECDLVCKIPLYGTVDCLNVSVAAGIALYHLRGKLEKSRIVK